MCVNDNFDAVYYAGPSNLSFQSLTLLALVFDHIHFPGIYIPDSGVDYAETIKELERIRTYKLKDKDHLTSENCIILALDYKYLKEFCKFTGSGVIGELEEGAYKIAQVLEEMIYGPPAPNFTPSFPLGFSKSLPGQNPHIAGPSWITYPANALVYSLQNELPLINDDLSLPVPALGNMNPKANAKILSRILAMESVSFVLPNVKALTPEQIVEVRTELSPYLMPFRMAMLRLSKELNLAIGTSLFPAVDDLRSIPSLWRWQWL